MSKKNRLDEILNLIDIFEIDTQEELTQRLLNKGYDVSQATVSRDIKDLGLIKCAGIIKKFKYCKPIPVNTALNDQMLNLFKQIVKSIINAENLIVVKTLSGNANSAGSVIDNMHLPQILGTIAGDDTLLIVTPTCADAEMVVKSLRML